MVPSVHVWISTVKPTNSIWIMRKIVILWHSELKVASHGLGRQPERTCLLLTVCVCVCVHLKNALAFCLDVCLCTTYMPGACGSQKRELELQTIVSHHVGARNWSLSHLCSHSFM